MRDLADDAQTISYDFDELDHLGLLADVMTAPNDERTVLYLLRSKVGETVKIIDMFRPTVSSEMGSCGNEPLVTTKAQALLDFMQSAKDQLSDPMLGLASP